MKHLKTLKHFSYNKIQSRKSKSFFCQMASTTSAMQQLVSCSSQSIDDLLADQGLSGSAKAHAAKLVSSLALFGVYCVTRKLIKHSKTFTKYCLMASQPLSSKTLQSQYAGEPKAWAMILNTVDQLGNAYCHELAALGFDIILCGTDTDQERMDGQSEILKQQYNVKTHIVVIEYNKLADSEQSYQEINDALSEYEICILVNNQTYAVPFDVARQDLLYQSIEACVVQINKHIKCSLLIQHLIVPKMLARRSTQKKIRSAILTLKTHQNALFEQNVGNMFQFPILRSAMAFNAALMQALHDQYHNKGIDVMQALTPYISFENWLSRGLILEVIMQERMLKTHVRAVLNHLRWGYAKSHGAPLEAYQSKFGTNSFFRYLSPQAGLDSRLFERYTQMCQERREQEMQNIEQLKNDVEEEMKTASNGSTPTMCEYAVQTSFISLTPEIELEEEESEEEEELKIEEIIEIVEQSDVDEHEFKFQPQDGDTLDFKRERVLYKAEMSMNNKAVLLATTKKQQEGLIKQFEKSVTLKQAKIEAIEQAKAKTLAPPQKSQPVELTESQSTAAESIFQSQNSASNFSVPQTPESSAEIRKPLIQEVSQKPQAQVAVEEPKKEETKIVKAEPKPAPVQAAPKPKPIVPRLNLTPQSQSEKKPEQKPENQPEKQPEKQVEKQVEKKLEPIEQPKAAESLLKPHHQRTDSYRQRNQSEQPSPRPETSKLSVNTNAGNLDTKSTTTKPATTKAKETTSVTEETTKPPKDTVTIAKQEQEERKQPKPITSPVSKDKDRSTPNSPQEEMKVERLIEEKKVNSSEEGKSDNGAPAMSVAPSEDTNDTNNVSTDQIDQSERNNRLQKREARNRANGPRPYNKKSRERAESRNGAKDVEKEAEETKEDKKKIAEKDTKIDEPSKSDKNKSPESEDASPLAFEGTKKSNPFSPRIAEIETSNDKETVRTGAETPAFRDKSVDIPVVSSAEPSQNDNSQNDQNNKTKDESVSPKRDLSPLIKVSVSKIGASSSKLSRKSQISNAEGGDSENSQLGEWKSSPLKTINITSLVNASKKKPCDRIVTPAYMPTDSDRQRDPVHISERTLDAETKRSAKESVHIMERTLDDIEDTDFNGTSRNVNKSLSPINQVSNTNGHSMKNALHNFTDNAPPKSGRDVRPQDRPFDSMLTPRNDDMSSSSDMKELRMAIGGNSDRSNNIIFQTGGMMDQSDVIFSDEGSNDSFARDEQAQDEQDIWQNPGTDNKASLQFMRAMTKKMESGDETDQAINKVLHNLVSNVLVGFNPNSSPDDPNLTKTAKLELRNSALIYELATCLPFVKIAPGRYLVGTEIRAIQIKGRGVLVRTGGGYMYLSEFLLHYAKSECLKMGLMILKQKKSFIKVVVGLLSRQPNTQSAQKDFIKKCPHGIDEQFQALVQETRQIEEKLAKKRKRSSIKTKKSLNTSGGLNSSMRSSDSNKKKSQPMIIQSLRTPMPKLVLPLSQTMSSGSKSPKKSSRRSLNTSSLQGGNSLREYAQGSHQNASPDVLRKSLPGPGQQRNTVSGNTGLTSNQRMQQSQSSGISTPNSRSPAKLHKSATAQSTLTTQLQSSLFTPVLDNSRDESTSATRKPKTALKTLKSLRKNGTNYASRAALSRTQM